MLPLRQLGKGAFIFVKRNSSTILSVLALAGVGAVGYFGYKAGENVAYDLAEEYERNGDFDKKTKAKIIVKNMAPVAAAGAVTWACIISSHVINIRKMKAMAASYAMLAESASVYRRKVIERIGEHKNDEIEGDIGQEEFDKDKDKEIVAVQTFGGGYLCKDGITGQYFRSDANSILKILDNLNAGYICSGERVSVNEYCAAFGLEPPCDCAGDLEWPSAMRVRPELRSVMCPNGEPGYYLWYSSDAQPMTPEMCDIYDTNHYSDVSYL